ncbi:hypothetical protein A4A49_64404, partial [Nicotiana attenuata]
MESSPTIQSSQYTITPLPKYPTSPKPSSPIPDHAWHDPKHACHQAVHNTLATPPSPIQQNHPPNVEREDEEEEEDSPTERVVEHGVLRSPKTLVFKARKEKRFILSCPLDLRKYSITIKKFMTPGIYQYAMVLVPTMFSNFWMSQEGTSSRGSSPPNREMSSNNRNISMSFISWNCRGAGNTDFRRAFRSMFDYHKPSVVALLETRLSDHHVIMEDFGFSGLAQVAAQGNSGGMALMWNSDEVNVDQIGGTDQEIHAMVKVKILP